MSKASGTEKSVVLAGDIGGTKTRLAAFALKNGLRKPVAEDVFESMKYRDFETIVREFVSRNAIMPGFASFGVAGPVMAGKAEITNLPWVIDEASLGLSFDFTAVRLLNDVAALAYSVPVLGRSDLQVLNRGHPDSCGTVAVVAPGTGLGEAYLAPDDAGFRVHASEGGHADFAPANDLEIGLLSRLMSRFGHVSCERVCSGMGIANIYAYLRDSGYGGNHKQHAGGIDGADNPVPGIVQAALDAEKPCPLCRKTVETFVSVLGAEAGNLCLKVMAMGGVYLGGGIPPRIVEILKNGIFMDAFTGKGRMSGLMARVPVYVIMNSRAGLLGAAHYAMKMQGKNAGSADMNLNSRKG
ncbi:MAG: glucokinase [bacterium]